MSSKPSRQAQLQAQERKKQQQYLLIAGAVAAVMLLGAGIIYPMLQAHQPTSTGDAVCSALEQPADEGRGHLKPGDPTPIYQTAPPTSGTHNPASLPAGVYDNNADVTMLVHSMEHGYVILFYNGMSQTEVNQLVNIQQSDPFKTIVAPYPNMSSKLAITAWGHFQRCDGVNEQAIRSFIAQFRNQGPEPYASMN
jgi:hypothetical protein